MLGRACGFVVLDWWSGGRRMERKGEGRVEEGREGGGRGREESSRRLTLPSALLVTPHPLSSLPPQAIEAYCAGLEGEDGLFDVLSRLARDHQVRRNRVATGLKRAATGCNRAATRCNRRATGCSVLLRLNRSLGRLQQGCDRAAIGLQQAFNMLQRAVAPRPRSPGGPQQGLASFAIAPSQSCNRAATGLQQGCDRAATGQP